MGYLWFYQSTRDALSAELHRECLKLQRQASVNIIGARPNKNGIGSCPSKGSIPFTPAQRMRSSPFLGTEHLHFVDLHPVADELRAECREDEWSRVHVDVGVGQGYGTGLRVPSRPRPSS